MPACARCRTIALVALAAYLAPVPHSFRSCCSARTTRQVLVKRGRSPRVRAEPSAHDVRPSSSLWLASGSLPPRSGSARQGRVDAPPWVRPSARRCRWSSRSSATRRNGGPNAQSSGGVPGGPREASPTRPRWRSSSLTMAGVEGSRGPARTVPARELSYTSPTCLARPVEVTQPGAPRRSARARGRCGARRHRRADRGPWPTRRALGRRRHGRATPGGLRGHRGGDRERCLPTP